MKKITFLAAIVALFTLGFSSCKQDTQPRIQKPTEFVLNEPVMAHMNIVLTAQSEVELAVSQANYGMGLVPVYSVEISQTEDFATFETVEGSFTQAKINVPGEAFALAMCSMLGYDDPYNFKAEAVPVYVRVRSEIPGWPEGTILSNVVKFDAVTPYFAVKLPAKLYVIGDVQGWDINSSALYLSEAENGIGSNVYYGTFEISAEQAEAGFRFYTALGGWGDDGQLPSIGAAAKDGDNKSVTIDDNGKYEGSCTAGKGNWKITNWPGGTIRITVDLNTMVVIFETV